MLLRKKLSTFVLCVVLVGSSMTGIGAATKDSIIGANRYETAAKIADRIGNYSTAILVNSDKSLADGLSASSLAGKENAPILLVKKDSIPKETLSRLDGVDKVYIIGGTSAISEKVESQLSGKTIKRIEGKDRVDTSKKVARMLEGYDEAFIVNGFKGEADAMSVASVAARDKAPILLTKGTSSDHAVKSGVDYYAIGGTAVVSNYVASKYSATRLGGSNRYNTNRIVVNKFYSNSSKLYYAKGDPLVDALTVSSLAKNNGVVLVSANSDNSILKNKDTVQVGGMNFSVDSRNKPPVITSSTDKLTFKSVKEMDLSKFNVRAYDSEDGDLTNVVMIIDPPTISGPGTYKLNLVVTDSEGLEGYKTLILVIEESSGSAGETTSNINSEAYQAELRKEFFKLLNQHRANNGVGDLREMSEMNKLAYLKSEHMAKLNYFSHQYDDTNTMFYKDKWDASNGYGKAMYMWDIYPEMIPQYRMIAENIYMLTGKNRTPKDLANQIFTGWKNSEGHNKNMLNGGLRYTGLGAYELNGRVYVTSNFITPW